MAEQGRLVVRAMGEQILRTPPTKEEQMETELVKAARRVYDDDVTRIKAVESIMLRCKRAMNVVRWGFKKDELRAFFSETNESQFRVLELSTDVCFFFAETDLVCLSIRLS